MKDKLKLTISERHRENTENVRITGHTENGEAYTFHIKVKTPGGLKVSSPKAPRSPSPV